MFCLHQKTINKQKRFLEFFLIANIRLFFQLSIGYSTRTKENLITYELKAVQNIITKPDRRYNGCSNQNFK